MEDWAAQWGESAHRNLRKAAVWFFNHSWGMCVLRQSFWQSCQVSAAEETEANGMVGSTILHCSVAQRMIRQKIIANNLSYPFVRLQVAPCEWWEMCLPRRYRRTWLVEQDSLLRNPVPKPCSNVKLCSVCAITHLLTRMIMLQRKPSGPHFQQGRFPHALIIACWPIGSSGWNVCLSCHWTSVPLSSSWRAVPYRVPTEAQHTCSKTLQSAK